MRNLITNIIIVIVINVCVWNYFLIIWLHLLWSTRRCRCRWYRRPLPDSQVMSIQAWRIRRRAPVNDYRLRLAAHTGQHTGHTVTLTYANTLVKVQTRYRLVYQISIYISKCWSIKKYDEMTYKVLKYILTVFTKVQQSIWTQSWVLSHSWSMLNVYITTP